MAVASDVVVEIEQVAILNRENGPLLGHFLDLPVAGTSSDVHAVGIQGWALEPSGPLKEIRIQVPSVGVKRVQLSQRRDDIGAAFPDVPAAEQSGYATHVGTIGLPERFELTVVGVLRTEVQVPLAVIRGQQHLEMVDTGETGLSPLIVTTLGRTGSTWLVKLLSMHRQLVAYRPFEFEPRIVSYWLEAVRAMSEPDSYCEALDPQLSGAAWWLGRSGAPQRLSEIESDLRVRLGKEAVTESLAFGREQVNAFYARVSEREGSGDVLYFIEKSWPNMVPQLTRQLWPASAEVFLVRDPRDMLCSVLSYNRKRGYSSFGREQVSSDLEFVRVLHYSLIELLRGWEHRRSRGLLVRYEDLVRRPDVELRRILGYLELEAEEPTVSAMVDGALESDTELQAGHRTSKTPLSSVGRWRRDLSSDLVAACESAFGDVIEELGYDAGGGSRSAT
jgi:hypothetical protein